MFVLGDVLENSYFAVTKKVFLTLNFNIVVVSPLYLSTRRFLYITVSIISQHTIVMMIREDIRKYIL